MAPRRNRSSKLRLPWWAFLVLAAIFVAVGLSYPLFFESRLKEGMFAAGAKQMGEAFQPFWWVMAGMAAVTAGVRYFMSGRE